MSLPRADPVSSRLNITGSRRSDTSNATRGYRRSDNASIVEGAEREALMMVDGDPLAAFAPQPRRGPQAGEGAKPPASEKFSRFDRWNRKSGARSKARSAAGHPGAAAQRATRESEERAKRESEEQARRKGEEDARKTAEEEAKRQAEKRDVDMANTAAPAEQVAEPVREARSGNCANCQMPGHTVISCVIPSDDGYVRGCPWCNVLAHQPKDCAVYQEMSSEDKYTFFVKQRAGCASLQVFWPALLCDFVRERGYDAVKQLGFPWTVTFAKSVRNNIPVVLRLVSWTEKRFPEILSDQSVTDIADVKAMFPHLDWP